MSALSTNDDLETDAPGAGVEFGQSAEGFPVARVGDIVLAMLPLANGGACFARACFVRRPLNELKRAGFYGHDGQLADEHEYRRRVHETSEHRRELHGLGRVQTRMAASTPWGSSQLATINGPGVIAHSTAGHGGFHLSADRNRLVDPALRNDYPWYEEDCEWAIVALTFPDLFTAYERKCADDTIRHSWPETWERIHGRILASGESRSKDRYAFEEAHVDDWVVNSAIYSGQHAGMTEVVATEGGLRGAGAERRFLVSSEEYGTRGPFGFVIDETRHQSYDGPSSFIGWVERDRWHDRGQSTGSDRADGSSAPTERPASRSHLPADRATCRASHDHREGKVQVGPADRVALDTLGRATLPASCRSADLRTPR